VRLDAELSTQLDEEAIVSILNGDSAPSASNEEPENYIRDLTQELRKDVDDWIDSGRKPDGSESPHWRNSAQATRAWQGAKSHVEHWAKLELQGEQPQLSLVPKHSSLTALIETKEQWGQIIATILLSDLRSRIAKCRYRKCQRYFLLRRAKPKPYTHGLFCRLEHNRAEAAMEGVSRRRTDADRRLLEYAARELLRLPRRAGSTVTRNVKERLVARLNARIARDAGRTRDRIHMNWVTRHWQVILEKAEELSHA